MGFSPGDRRGFVEMHGRMAGVLSSRGEYGLIGGADHLSIFTGKGGPGR